LPAAYFLVFYFERSYPFYLRPGDPGSETARDHPAIGLHSGGKGREGIRDQGKPGKEIQSGLLCQSLETQGRRAMCDPEPDQPGSLRTRPGSSQNRDSVFIAGENIRDSGSDIGGCVLLSEGTREKIRDPFIRSFENLEDLET